MMEKLEVELSERVGVIHADLRIGADLTRALPLHANEGLCSRGVQLYGRWLHRQRQRRR